MFDDPFSEKNHQLPDGNWVSLQVQSDPLRSQWTHVSICFITGPMQPAWCRVFTIGATPPEWKSLKPARAVDTSGGSEEEDSDKDAQETARENKGKLTATRKLKPGRYVLQSKIRVGTKDVELPPVEFEVRRGPLGAGWG